MSRERELMRFNEVGKKINGELDASFQMAIRRHNMPPPPSGTLNTITPCAACKLLRRRCAQECPFSPYFSPHEPHKFASVHKVFGASNVSKMLMEVPESQRADAANSLVYEANVRLRDPIYGCMGTILALQQHVQSLQAELNAVRAEILHFKCRESNVFPSSHVALLSSGVVSVAALPPGLSPSPPPPLHPPVLPPPLLPPTSSSSSLYTPASNSTEYSTISNF
ncbi:LOB domain-containing protein 15 [Diospyros lotus]|uniref:LOB domain-containing protein 15 n=1 Tax=Diospyros lotus TaxID=55363 RepID=UPI002255DE88|nr:LOB domain-containing protein 15 [Diospyros lotus]